ncbi:NDP-sugar synthase [Streptomyces sp. NPDC049577]|uniref:NDP-sugar synthase n=1 Tax=Streptomyces sp. NPDC049577 TaxID=3155153 RepID=UPI00341B59A2
MTEAVLLVGGKGTRLQPLTINTPKPMVPAAGVPFLAHQLARARAAGVRHVVLATCYLAEVFEPYFGDGSAHGLRLTYVTEDEPLGTGGAIRAASDALGAAPGDPVLVFNGDILTGLDIRRLLHRHEQAQADVTLHLTRVADPRAFGLVPTDADGRVLAFTEKPGRPEEIVTDQINAGCYVFRREVIDTIPAGRPVSVERETFPGLLAGGARLHGVVDTAYWLDLGRPASFVQASADLVRGIVRSPAVPGETGEHLVLPGAHVEPGARLGGGTVVGAGAHVAAGAEVEGSVVLDGARVEADARVRASMVGAGARVGARTVLDGVVIGDHSDVGADNELREGARVWCGMSIPDAAIRFSAV